MLQKITTTMLIGSSLVHLLCCGLPLLLGLVSIAAWAGWNGALQFSIPHLHDYEGVMIAASGGLILLTAIANFIATKINCTKDNFAGQISCHHEPCDKEKTFAQKIFIVALTFWIINFIHFAL